MIRALLMVHRVMGIGNKRLALGVGCMIAVTAIMGSGGADQAQGVPEIPDDAEWHGILTGNAGNDMWDPAAYVFDPMV